MCGAWAFVFADFLSIEPILIFWVSAEYVSYVSGQKIREMSIFGIVGGIKIIFVEILIFVRQTA